jgi:hypothetical protein
MVRRLPAGAREIRTLRPTLNASVPRDATWVPRTAPVSESRAVIVTLAALPILWTPNVVVARKVVGGFRVAIPGALLFD